MGVEKYLLLFASFMLFLRLGNGCQMEGVGNWLLTQDAQVLDTFSGTFLNRATTNIQEVTGITVGGSVNYAPYLNIQLADGYFSISTTEGYAQYEENETSEFISFTVNFRCSDASTNSLIFSIRVVDTNNNPPTFRPSSEYEFTITPPLPPGFQITGFFGNDILVRDIDLTTSRIDFTIQDNEYFEIAYEGRSASDQKEFIASLKTKDLIRSLPGVVELSITATDVDATGDPPITSSATIRVRADESFVFPEEPVFTRPFYMATYTENQVVLEQAISLRQGYDEEVTFSLEGEHSDYFDVSANGNEISIVTVASLQAEVLRNARIILAVNAEREYTSGASTTVIIELPEILGLEFAQTHYSGQIVDNVLQPLQLTLSQGYQDGFNVTLQNEFASYFSASNQANVITLEMTPLDTQIINENNFLTLQVIASNNYETAVATVTLEIVKNDSSTPVFEKDLYIGAYNQESGLTVETITLAQGFDDSIEFSLLGEHSEFFAFTNDGPVVILTSSGVPSELWIERQLLLTIIATKPRLVPATTTVAISLPEERLLAFESPIYKGTMQENSLLLEPIVLSTGYANDINYTLSGDYSEYFTLSSTLNQVNIILPSSISENIITDNSFLSLKLTANGVHTVETSTTIVLEIIKQDSTTPVFSENIYRAAYLDDLIEMGNISLAQGYDNSVSFRLDGENSQYFQIANNGNSFNIVLASTIPAEVLYREKVLVFSVLADKPFTVGAVSAVSVSFPEELTKPSVMKFAQNTYIGSLDRNTLNLEDVVLESGYENGTVFLLSGEFSSYFQLEHTNDVTTISLQNTLPEEVFANDFIVLELEASRERAVSTSTSIVLSIAKETIAPPVFSNAYYKSVYANNTLEDLTITLSEGYDDTVTFELQGDSSVWFSITNIGNTVSLTRNMSIEIPENVLQNSDYFLFSIAAYKTHSISSNAAIFIHLPKDTPETVIVRFSQTSYVGRIENGELYAPTITLLGEREPISFNLTGEYASYFEVAQTSATNVQIRFRDGLPENIDEISLIVVDIEAQYPQAISGYASVIFEVVPATEIEIPVFEQAYYIGEYSEQRGLQFEQPIRLSQGFDESVVFTLTGDDAQWFELNSTVQNSLTLIGTGLQQIIDRSHLVFTVVANKEGSISAETAVIINLSDFSISTSLRFAEHFYEGSIQTNNLTIDNIILEEGYTSDMNISFTGDYTEYFQLTNEEGIFTLQLSANLPQSIIDGNNYLVFTLEVNIENARAHTTIVLELVKDQVTSLAFEEAYYLGSYSIVSGFTFDPQITLLEGYDETVSFSLVGEDSQWFGLVNELYPLELIQTDPIPNEVISNNKQLIFVVVAEKPGNVTARSTIIVSIIDDSTVLEFEKNIYLGTIEGDATTIDTITLTAGYSQNVSFDLLGDLENYFSVAEEEASITVSLRNSIPQEFVPNNGIILLELQASAPQAISAYTTLVFGIIRRELEVMQFEDVYYTGSYTATEGLDFQRSVILIQGFDENVEFVLEGDDSQYLQAIQSNNSVSLELSTSIPAEVIMNNQRLIFAIRADRDNTSAWATIVIDLKDEFELETVVVLQFEQNAYLGLIENNSINLDPIILSTGYSENVTYVLRGGLESYFGMNVTNQIVTITLDTLIPDNLIPENGIIILEVQAMASNAISAVTTIVLDAKDDEANLETLAFSNVYYTGTYTENELLSFNENISLVEGYDETVQFSLEGDDSQYFEINSTSKSIYLTLIAPIPTEMVTNRHQLIFNIRAEKNGALPTRTTIVIALINEEPVTTILQFDRISYTGSLDNNSFTLEPIILRETNAQNVTFNLIGDLSNYFNKSETSESIILSLDNPIPDELIPENKIIILELHATAPDAISAFATIVIKVTQENDTSILDNLAFDQVYYTGFYVEERGINFTNPMTLKEGYNDNVTFALEGDSSQYFEPVISDNSVLLNVIAPIPSAVVMNNQQLIFIIRAERPDAAITRATIVISLLDEYNETTPVLGFSQINYIGSLESDVVNHESIVLSEGYSNGVEFSLRGVLQTYFTLTSNGAIVSVELLSMIPEELVPSNKIIVLEIQASSADSISAHTTLILEVVQESFTELVFSEPFYTGEYSTESGLSSISIQLSQGYDESVVFFSNGDAAQWFQLMINGNDVTVVVNTEIPESVLENNRKLVFVIIARKSDISTTAVVIISLVSAPVCSSASFENVLYEGIVQGNQVSHGIINLYDFDGTDIELFGEYAPLFSASFAEGLVTVESSGSMTLPADITYVALEMQAGTATAVLLLEVIHTETPVLPTVTFGSPSYILQTDVSHSGLLGRVTARADNGEAVTYSLAIDNDHLLQRVSISEEGDLHLSAPASSGIYSFQVVATTVFTRATGEAMIHLTVEALSIVDEEYILPPLQILDRDEESAHENVIPFNVTMFEGCAYRLINQWPLDQSWLYVDENGLHTRPIDREHESIAFMALSQVQIELILECDSDTTISPNSKEQMKISFNRGIDTDLKMNLEHLGPYDYGNKNWILTESINHNPRRSLVNLIVNDINDNYPIFEEQDNQPLVVGYPVAELEEIILPRALVEVRATDADVGENAALLYWSSHDVLAVSPSTGSVHVRDVTRLVDGSTLTVYATDRNGQGLTGSLNLLVKLVDTNHIAVVTVSSAFLVDEANILNNLTTTLGYEVKALKSTIISDNELDETDTRQKREAIISNGASLQLYVYGIIQREPVDVARLTEDLNRSEIETVIIARTVSLEDHLESLEICPLPGRDTVLFVSTIVLAALLFILIVAAVVWFFLKWRKNRNYDEFSDENSLASRTDVVVVENAPKPELSKPRINIEDLKRSERRLQEILDAPNTSADPQPEKSAESKLNIPELPFVIQSIDKLKAGDESDDEDEFGERKKIKPRRKSVVTFNENVEKIIHVEDTPEDSDVEVYKL